MNEIESFVEAGRAAEFLRLSRRRVLQMAREKAIPGHPIGGGSRKTWRFRLSELAEAIAAREVCTTVPKRGIITAGGPIAVPKRKD
jgi:helix-turn-helix protein